ncbi:mitochondrial thiamine pyrophosphate transporter [Scheffersomyces xylosifermentans]|uniref:mitochondrial thiamine pyrophosphate transporter n=1 Tax=Scheffersomyces xylosifermentans TaxID=1304137 RepID=UPI00315DF074
MESGKREDHLRKGSDVSPYESLLAGSISGGMSRAITAPLDTIKIRLQLQRKTFKNRQPVQSVVSELLKKEGVIGLWKGNVPAEILYVLYGATQFTSYSFLSQALSTFEEGQNWSLSSSGHTLLAGTGAGICSTLTTYPFDLLRTRLAANSNKKLLSMTQTIKDIYKADGLLGFFAGIKPAMLSIASTTGIMFSSYELAREFTRDRDIPFKEGLCGFIAGATSKGITFPLDTLRKRTQMYQTLYGGRSTSAYKLFFNIVSAEGVFGLYKGFGVSVLKTAPTSAISLYVYEYSITAIKKLNTEVLA